MPVEIPSGQQADSHGREELWRNLIDKSRLSVGNPGIRQVLREACFPVLVGAERYGIGIGRRDRSWKLFHDIQGVPLKVTALFLGIAGQTDVEGDDRNSLRVET